MTHVKSNMLERPHLQTTIGTRSNMTCSVVLTCLLHFFPTEFRTLLSRIAPPSAPHNIQAQILIPQHNSRQLVHNITHLGCNSAQIG